MRALVRGLIVVTFLSAAAQAAEPDGFVGAVIRQGRSYKALAPLARLAALRDESSRARFTALVARLAASKGLSPSVRRHVVRLQAELRHAAGDVDGARELLRQDGAIVDGWFVLGPLTAQESPSLDATARFARPGGALGWRDVSQPWPLGALPLGSLLSPTSDDESVALAVTLVYSDKPRPVLVRAAFPAKALIAVNGVDTTTGAATLAAGWNRVAVTSTRPAGGDWTLTVYVTRPDGAPLGLPVPIRRASPFEVELPAGAPAKHAVAPDPAREWESATGPAMDRARVLHWLGVPAGDVEPENTVAALRDAAILAKRADLALRTLDRLLALAPNDTDARVLAARKRHERGQSLSALSDVRAALADRPGHLGAAVLEAEMLADAQALGVAQARLERLAQEHKDVPFVLRALASVYQRRQLPEKALVAYQALARLDAGGGDAVYWQVEIARGLGQPRTATEASAELLRLRPDVVGHRLLAARLKTDTGDEDGARDVLDSAAEVFPRDAEVAEATGRFALRLGEKARAVASLRRALELRPHQPDLRERVEALDSEKAGFEAPFRADAVALAKAAPPPGPDAPDAEVLLSQRVTRLFEDGTTATWTQIVLRQNRVPSPSYARTWQVPHDPSRQSVTVLAAKRVREGQVIEDSEESDRTLSEAWYNLYYEQRATIIRFPRVQAGDVLALEHRLSEFSRALYGGSFGDLVGLQDDEPRAREVVAWIAPASVPLNVRVLGGDGPAPVETMAAELRTTTLTLTDVPAIASEPGMPGYTDVSLYAHASTFADWDAVASWYMKLAEDKPSPALTRAARDAVAGATTPEQKVVLLHRLATRDVRYVGLEFGVHSYKPYASADVLERRFGDCKDKANLLRQLLATQGIDSQMVLVRTRPRGAIAADVASPSGFDHAILYVPSVDLYLDATAIYHGARELPAADQDAAALVVSKDGGRFVRLPVAPADANVIERSFKVELRATEGALLTASLTASGVMAPPLRQQFSVPAARKEALERLVNGEFPGSHVTDSGFVEVADTAAPVRLTFKAEAPTLRVESGRLRLVPAGFSLVRSLASRATRKHDLVLDSAFVWRWRYEVSAPPGKRVRVPAASTPVSGPFGSVSVKPDGDGWLVEIRIAVQRVAAADYPAFRAFLRQADELLGPAVAPEVVNAAP